MDRIQWVLSLIDRLSAPANRMEQALRRVQSAQSRVEQATKHMNDAIARVRGPADLASRALGGLRAAATGLAVGAATLGAVGVAGALGAKSIIDAAGYKEQTLIAFKSLLGDSAIAANVYAHAVQFAATTPFDTPGVVDATKQLLSYGFATKDLQGVLTSAGNVAAGMGKPLEQAVLAFSALKSGDFGQAFGVGQGFNQLAITKKQLEGEGLVFDRQGSYKGTVEAGMSAVQRIIAKKFGDGMNAQSKSIFGLASTLQSRPFELFSSINDTGALDPIRKLMGNLAELTDFSKPPGSRIQQRFSESIGALFKAVFGPAAAATAGRQGENLVNTVLDKIDLFARWITVNGPKIVGTVKSVFDTIGTAIGVVTPIIAALGPYIPMIFAFFAAFRGALVIGNFIAGTIAAVSAISSVTAALGAAGGAMTVVGAVVAAIGGPVTLIALGIGVAAALVVANWSRVTAFFAGIPAFFSRIWGGVVALTTRAFDVLKFLFLNFTPLGFLIKNFTPIITWFQSLPNIFNQLGVNMLQGLLNGIGSMIGKVTGAIKSVADSVVGIFSGPKGIDAHSPSRKFFQQGAYIPAGLEMGILSGRGAVQRAITALATGATLTAGVSVAAGTSQNPRAAARAPVAAVVTGARAGGNAQRSGSATLNVNLSVKGEGVTRTDADTVTESVMEKVAEALEALGFEVGLGAR